MRNLKDCIIEEFEGMVTPVNTMGEGNPEPPTMSDKPGDVEGAKPGSGDLFGRKKKKTKSIVDKIKLRN